MGLGDVGCKYVDDVNGDGRVIMLRVDSSGQ